MPKTDYKQQLKELYGGKVGQYTVVDVPLMHFLMVDGHGNPNTAKEFQDAIEALFPVAYTLKFMAKRELDHDYGVMPLEGLFWAENMDDFNAEDKDSWLWTLMIMQPGVITKAMFGRAIAQVVAKKNPASLSKVRFETFHEGRAAQVMYVGPYADEGPTIEKLHDYIKENDGVLNGASKRHHEIYLNDSRRTAPPKLKTVIRQPY